MNKKLILFYVLFALVLIFNACSNDNDRKDPEGTVTLNIMNEDNGKTNLVNSDVYINKSNNFKAQSWYMIDAGIASLNTDYQPGLQNITHESAVQSGHLYYLYNPEGIVEFPSGTRAAYEGTSYYKIVVVSPILENGINKGAVIKYVQCYPLSSNLPEKETSIGQMTSSGDQLKYSVPKDAEYAAGTYLQSEMKYFDIQLDAGELTVKLNKYVDKVEGPYGDYMIYIRSGNVCTSLVFHVIAP